MSEFPSSKGTFTLHNPTQYWDSYGYDVYGERGGRIVAFNSEYYAVTVPSHGHAWLLKRSGDFLEMMDRISFPSGFDLNDIPYDNMISFDGNHILFVVSDYYGGMHLGFVLKRDGDTISFGPHLNMTIRGTPQHFPNACVLDSNRAFVAQMGYEGTDEFSHYIEIERTGDQLSIVDYVEEINSGVEGWAERYPLDMLKLGQNKVLVISQYDSYPNQNDTIQAAIYSKSSGSWKRITPHVDIRNPEFVTPDAWESGGGATIIGDHVVIVYSSSQFRTSGIYAWTVEATSFSIAGDIIKDPQTKVVYRHNATYSNEDIYGLWANSFGDSAPLTANWYTYSRATGNYTWHMINISVNDDGSPKVGDVEYFDHPDYGINDPFAPNVTGTKPGEGVAVWADQYNLVSIAAVLTYDVGGGVACLSPPEDISNSDITISTSLEEEV